MGVNNLFWDESVITTHVDPDDTCGSVFSCDLCALPSAASAQVHVESVGFVLIFSTFCIFCFFFSSLLSCVWGSVQADVAFRAQLSTVRIANDRLSENGLNFHHRTVPSNFWHRTDFSVSVALTLLVSGKTSENASSGC